MNDLIDFVTRYVWSKPDLSDREIVDAIRFHPTVKARRDHYRAVAEATEDEHTLALLNKVCFQR